MKRLFAAVALLTSVGTASAAPFDGSVLMKCAIESTMTCSDPKICVAGTAATALLPPVLNVDVPNKKLSGDASGRIVKIVSVGHGPGRLVLHGEEVEMSGTAWNVVIEQKGGALRGAVLTYVSAYLVFGTCTER